jgi:RNA polymerase sigma-70 factor (ECF subfamily)
MTPTMPGPPPSFEDVVRDHGPMIQRIAAAHEADAGMREDLAQDILYALWRALPGFRGDCALRTFVARIATNRAVTHVQRALRRPPSLELPANLPEPGAGPEQSAIAADRAERLRAAVRALPLALRETALLALEGLSQPEIAEVLGVTTNAVAVRMSRARTELRSIMGDIG